MIHVSAKQGTGVDKLLETVERPSPPAPRGASSPTPRAPRARGRPGPGQAEGRHARALVDRSLKMGDAVLVGAHWGKVRAIADAYGHKLEEAGACRTPLQIWAWAACPPPGGVRRDGQRGRTRAAATRGARGRGAHKRHRRERGGFAPAAAKDDEDGVQTINVIVKTDVSRLGGGGARAARALPQDRVLLRFLHGAAEAGPDRRATSTSRPRPRGSCSRSTPR